MRSCLERGLVAQMNETEGYLYPCRFCGTAVMVMEQTENPGEYAARNCTCRESRNYKMKIEAEERREQDIEAANEAVNKVLLEGCENDDTRMCAAGIMRGALEGLMDDHIAGLTVKSYGESFKLTKTAKGKIKVERTEVRARSMEV